MMAAAGMLIMHVRVRRRWWLNSYLITVAFLCGLFDLEPNWERIEWWVMRGVVAEYWTGRRWKRARLVR